MWTQHADATRALESPQQMPLHPVGRMEELVQIDIQQLHDCRNTWVSGRHQSGFDFTMVVFALFSHVKYGIAGCILLLYGQVWLFIARIKSALIISLDDFLKQYILW